MCSPPPTSHQKSRLNQHFNSMKTLVATHAVPLGKVVLIFTATETYVAGDAADVAAFVKRYEDSH